MPFLVAVSFLTRVLLGAAGARAWERSGEGALARAAVWFGPVGALVGAAVGLIAAAVAPFLGPEIAAVLAVVATVVITGALHLDGLADCADGTGGADRPARLRIMKDHATGAYGAAAIVLDLLLTVTLVEHLVTAWLPWSSSLGVVLALAAVHAAARVALLPLAHLLPYVRAEGGTGGMLIHGLSRSQVVLGCAVGGALALALGTAAAGLTTGLAIVAGAALGATLVALWARRVLGGVTGDVLGACVEVATLMGLTGALLTIG